MFATRSVFKCNFSILTTCNNNKNTHSGKNILSFGLNCNHRILLQKKNLFAISILSIVFIYLQSPQTPRSFGHQSPTTNPNRSPAYAGQSNQIIQQVPNPQAENQPPIAPRGGFYSQGRAPRQDAGGVLLAGGSSGYAQAPGTPRPGFASDTVRPTVYASSTSPYTSPRNEQFPQENNRQLRDLLQRQQHQPVNIFCLKSFGSSFQMFFYVHIATATAATIAISAEFPRSRGPAT